MPLWLVPFSLTPFVWATEPVLAQGPDPVSPASISLEIVLPWDQVGLRPAVPESPAIGPDLFALGPYGAAAVYDPVGRRVVLESGRSFPVAGADGLAFTGTNVILVMDGASRVLRAYEPDGTLLDEQGLPGIAPPGGSLSVRSSLVLSIDVFGNGHPIATVSVSGALSAPKGPFLVPPAHTLVRAGASLLVDGAPVATLTGRGGGRLYGTWLLVEDMNDGAVSRTAIPLGGGASVTLPARGRVYTPSQDVSVAPDGSLGYLDPQADGLHVVRVSP